MTEDLGRIEGLYDVTDPCREYAVPGVFKSTGYVRRRLTPHKWLALHEVPVAMIPSLCTDANARGDVALGIPGLIVMTIISSLWGRVHGGGPGEQSQDNILSDVPQHRLQEQQLQQQRQTPLSRSLVPTQATSRSLDDEVRIQHDQEKEVKSDDVPTHAPSHGSDDVARLASIRIQHDLAKAVKADDAEVPVHIWNDRVTRGRTSPEESGALEHIWEFALRFY